MLRCWIVTGLHAFHAVVGASSDADFAYVSRVVENQRDGCITFTAAPFISCHNSSLRSQWHIVEADTEAVPQHVINIVKRASEEGM